MKRSRKLAIATAVAALGTALAAVPLSVANAHDGCVAHGEDVACVRNGHKTIDWCDRENDTNRVYAQFTISYAGYVYGPYTTGYDPNGHYSGCGHWNTNDEIFKYRVCEEGVGCSEWAWAKAMHW
ncbi:MAG: hypothetical protein ACRDT4_07480 [Micromonosporaceae bacterium]